MALRRGRRLRNSNRAHNDLGCADRHRIDPRRHLTLRATDASGAIGTSFSDGHRIRPPTSLPLMLPVIPNKTDATGDSVSETLPEAIQGLAPFIYSATGLPTGLRLRNRVIEGIPLLPGAFTVSYVVTDSNQDIVTRTFTWTITGMPVPQPSGLNLRIDWGDQFYASPHSDVTGHVTSDIECERGKNTASAILGRSQAGTLTCELQNSDGLFDDENINSPLLGLIRPGIQVQLRHGVTPLWTGVLDSIPTRFEQNGQHRATVNALGVLSDSIDPIVTAGSLTPESTAQAFIETCTKADLPYESPQPMPGDAYVMRRWWERARARHIFDVLEETEGGFIFEDREGELGFHLQPYRAGKTVTKTFVTTTPGANQIHIVGNPRRQHAVKDVHNSVQGQVKQFQEIVDEEVFVPTDAIPIGLGEALDIVSPYPAGFGAVRSLNAVSGWTANNMPDGSGSDLTSQVAITAELMDFNEIHVEILYGVIMGQAQESTIYIRDLVIEGTVFAQKTALLITRTVESQFRPKTLLLEDNWLNQRRRYVAPSRPAPSDNFPGRKPCLSRLVCP